MVSRQADIEALLDHAKADFEKIQTEYQGSLHNKSIDPSLKIDIKNLCENLRSILDYLAHEIRENCCPNAKGGERFYFPVFTNEGQFRSTMSRWFPGLDKSCSDIWSYLESVQPYKGAVNQWLALFNRLNNENKHGSLVQQTRTETEEIRATSQDGSQVSWKPSEVKFESGVLIGGVAVDPATQMPVPHHSQKVERIIWVEFEFDGLAVSALSLLKQSLEGVEAIATNLRELLRK